MQPIAVYDTNILLSGIAVGGAVLIVVLNWRDRAALKG